MTQIYFIQFLNEGGVVVAHGVVVITSATSERTNPRRCRKVRMYQNALLYSTPVLRVQLYCSAYECRGTKGLEYCSCPVRLLQYQKPFKAMKYFEYNVPGTVL
jgi:hypothetical protein